MTESEKPKKKTRFHLSDIPKKYFPRNTKAKEYLNELSKLSFSLRFTNTKIQYSAQICSFNIRSITGQKLVNPRRDDVLREIDEFVYHYENYCFRLHAYREKILQFVNAILPVGYSDKEVSIKHILINPIVKGAKIVQIIEKFQKDPTLSHIISNRTKLTHRLSSQHRYLMPKIEDEKTSGKKIKSWFDKWRTEIEELAEEANSSTISVSRINNNLAEKIIKFKEKK